MESVRRTALEKKLLYVSWHEPDFERKMYGTPFFQEE